MLVHFPPRAPAHPLAVICLSTWVAFAGLCHPPAASSDSPLPDFSDLSFTGAFDSLCVYYGKHYAFSEWKQIDWAALHDLYAPEILQAEATADAGRFRSAMKHFLSHFPDGHVRLRGDLSGLFEDEIGGGFGLNLIQLSDGRIAVNHVIPGGAADNAGIELGAVIAHWEGAPPESALAGADIVWEGNPPATREGRRLAQLRRLARAPVGRMVALTYANPDQEPVSTTLVAEDDRMETWEFARYTAFGIHGDAIISPEQMEEPVTHEILPSGLGYLKCSILVEFDEHGNVTGSTDGILTALQEAVAAFNAASLPGIVVDIRDNPGGFDRLAAAFGGFFYDHAEVYEHASFYSETTSRFAVVPHFDLYLEPQADYFSGPVVCLVNAGTASSAEGIAMAIQRLARGYVMGIHGTHGSFGLVSGESALPADLGAQFTLGRSLDAGLEIQIDSDQALMGGVAPDIRIPLTVPAVQEMFGSDVDVELREAEAFLAALTPVRLIAFTVERGAAEAVLTWTISEGHDRSAFHIWRESAGEARRRLSSEPIVARGRFRYVDPVAPAGEATYWLQEIAADGSDTWLASVVLPPAGSRPGGAMLYPSRPTPFSSLTRIPISLGQSGPITLAIYDVRGRPVRLLRNEVLSAGSHLIEWDGRSDDGALLPSGVYFCELVAGAFRGTRTMTLLR